ncbi:MAG TPA: aldolase/citrate lyase family protein, partial [Stellaceae bacterium]|nr:aldolase/citrate lyase family protein [Stellaceae bacterium]
PWLDPSDIGKILDAGVLGVICPMINSAAEAELLVRYCKYPPRGDRSLGPIRAAMLDGDAYPAGANQAVAVFAMVETAVSLANLDEILAVDGVDGIYIGPGDLAVSMGVEPRMEGYHPDVDRAIDRIAQACATHGKIAGILAPNPDAGRRMLQRGFRFLTLSSDARALAAQARGWVTDVRRHAEGLQL